MNIDERIPVLLVLAGQETDDRVSHAMFTVIPVGQIYFFPYVVDQ